MKILIRLIALLAAASVGFTILFIAGLLAAGGLSQLMSSGMLGAMTIAGWALTLVCGPIAAVQLWRLRRSGWIAALLMFGYGLVYYIAGLLWLKADDAPVTGIILAIVCFACPVGALLSRPARLLLSRS